MQQSTGTSPQTLVQQNLVNRQNLMSNKMASYINNQGPTLIGNLGVGSSLNLVAPGYIDSIDVYLTVKVTNTGASALAITPMGSTAAFSSIVLTDSSNNQRIGGNSNYPSFMYYRDSQFLRASKGAGKVPYGQGLYSNTSTYEYGQNNSKNAPATIAVGGNATFTCKFNLLCTDGSMRNLIGALQNVGNTNNVTQNPNLRLQLNPNFITPGPNVYTINGITTGSVYTGTGTVTVENLQVVENFYLNVGANPQPPLLDISNIYMYSSANPAVPNFNNVYQDLPANNDIGASILIKSLTVNNNGVIVPPQFVNYGNSTFNITQNMPYEIFYDKMCQRLGYEVEYGLLYNDYVANPMSTSNPAFYNSYNFGNITYTDYFFSQVITKQLAIVG